MRKIALHGKWGEGKFVKVDDDMFERLNQWEWHVIKNRFNKHVGRLGKNSSVIFLHREIMKANGKQRIAFINGNFLDCRRENLQYGNYWKKQEIEIDLDTGAVKIWLHGKNSQGKFTLIDKEDLEWLSQWQWCFHDRGCGYAYGNINGKPNSMHRLIMNAQEGLEVDHINGDGLDNRKSNLRIVSHSVNTKNRTRVNKNNTSKHLGVYWISYMGKWGVQIKKDYKLHYFGSFANKQDAIAVARVERQKLLG